MGIFDSLLRKKYKKKMVHIEQKEKPVEKPVVSKSSDDEINVLLEKYQRLIEKRDELIRTRQELTEKLDRGEVSPIEFRKILIEKIKENTEISMEIREISAKLAELGHPVVG